MVAQDYNLGSRWPQFWVLDPMCESWFRKRLEELRAGEASLITASAWQKRIRYDREKMRPFINNSNIIGRDFLVKDCMIQTL